MKKIAFPLIALSLLFTVASCNNEETTEVKTTTPAPAKEAEPAKVTVKEEPAKTQIKVGEGGAEVKTKSGTEVKVGDNGTKVATKDIDVKIDPKNK